MKVEVFPQNFTILLTLLNTPLNVTLLIIILDCHCKCHMSVKTFSFLSDLEQKRRDGKLTAEGFHVAISHYYYPTTTGRKNHQEVEAEDAATMAEELREAEEFERANLRNNVAPEPDTSESEPEPEDEDEEMARVIEAENQLVSLCPVCKDEMAPDKVWSLYCGHQVCADCVDFLVTCGMCRSVVVGKHRVFPADTKKRKDLLREEEAVAEAIALQREANRIAAEQERRAERERIREQRRIDLGNMSDSEGEEEHVDDPQPGKLRFSTVLTRLLYFNCQVLQY